MINYITIAGGARKYYLAKRPNGIVKDGLNVIFYSKEGNTWVEQTKEYIPANEMTVDEISIRTQLLILE